MMNQISVNLDHIHFHENIYPPHTTKTPQTKDLGGMPPQDPPSAAFKSRAPGKPMVIDVIGLPGEGSVLRTLKSSESGKKGIFIYFYFLIKNQSSDSGKVRTPDRVRSTVFLIPGKPNSNIRNKKKVRSTNFLKWSKHDLKNDTTLIIYAVQGPKKVI